mgnify:CR=1 FL=1
MINIGQYVAIYKLWNTNFDLNVVFNNVQKIKIIKFIYPEAAN